MSGNEWAIGVDIGGTNVKMGLVSRESMVEDFRSFPTPRDGSGALDVAALSDRVAEHASGMSEWSALKGIGVGVPGILNERRTVVRYAVNLGMRDAPLAGLLQDRWKLPVTLDSDVIMGAFGELRHGSAAGFDRFLYVSIGTGIGACLYEKGGFYRNPMGGPLNIGHMAIHPDGLACACGNQGCLERYVSGVGLAGRYAAESGENGVGVERICSLAEDGDRLARKLLAAAGQALGVAFVNLAQIFGSCPIVVGGGLSRIQPMLEHAAQVYRERGSSVLSADPVIRAAAFPDRSGVMGAARSVFL